VRVLAVVGPTSSGKTALSIPLAESLGGEIISMDSRQVYRGMDIGTDKISRALQAVVPHHGLDLVDPDVRYSAGRFGRDARRWIGEIRARRRLPLLVGGTGFFLRALTNPVFREPPLDPERRDRLRGWLAERPLEELDAWARALDPERADLAGKGGRQRLSRTIEIPLLSGFPLSWWHRHSPPEEDPVPVAIARMDLPREELARRIDTRAAAMFERGLLEEVERLLDAGFSPADYGMTGTGYREAAWFLQGKMSREEAVDRVRRVTRAYARRQLTWYRTQMKGEVWEVDAMAPVEEQVAGVVREWERTGGVSGG
jgi:tRNA dimethylallyltransferase